MSGVPGVAAAQAGDADDAFDALGLDGVAGRAGETEVVPLDVVGARVRRDEPQDAVGALERLGEDVGIAVGALDDLGVLARLRCGPAGVTGDDADGLPAADQRVQVLRPIWPVGAVMTITEASLGCGSTSRSGDAGIAITGHRHSRRCFH
ncbi:hypothetical protein GCM10010495_43430 [Kitasatospora herbaricolor]|nr:hypothetical protein GCM10010495_43430 [Kitasatospora herbaricolor]